VNVGLVADVEEDAVGGRGEDVVQSDGQLDHAEIGTEVAAVGREHGNQIFADFAGQLFHLGNREALDVSGRIDQIENAWHSFKRAAAACRAPLTQIPRCTVYIFS
jgi:hypothetical protein